MPDLSEKAPLQIVEGPVLLHANAAGEWGGHTFSYIISSATNVFWSAMLYESGRTSRTMLLGQYPKKNFDRGPTVTRVSLDSPNYYNSSLPLLVRTPDGFIHIFVGVTHDTGNPNLKPGVLRYFRSAAPDDITSIIDRTELIPTNAYNEFHLRMNVGISCDGKKLVWVVLAVSIDGKVPFNTPVVFFAERKGVDFSFQKPVAYASAMGLFYPLVAVRESGALIVRELWDDAKRPHARLIQLDWSGKVVHQEDLPCENEGSRCAYELRPLPATNAPSPEQANDFILYVTKSPVEHRNCLHEFWAYSSKEMRLRLLRSIATDYSWSNTGKWLPLSEHQSVFINNPSSGQLCVWHGDILGAGEVKRTMLAKSDPISIGMQGSYYVMSPSPLVGSTQTSGDLYLMTDCPNPGKKAEAVGPCSLLLYHVGLHVP